MRIAVTGAGGGLGGQVVRLLAADPGHEVVAIGRRNLAGSVPGHVRAAVADYADPAALRTALAGVDTLVLVSSDGEAVNVLLHHRNVIQAAADRGVTHVVALSSVDADVSSPFCYAVVNGHTEQILRDSGCRYSVARASIYTEFFLRWLTEARRRTGTSGELRLPAAGGRISLISRDDVGRCLVALAMAAPTGRHHDLTGPEALDLATMADLASRAWQTPIRYVDLTPARYRVEMARTDLDAWWMYAFSTMFDSVREQRWTAVTGEVARLTGRPPASLYDVLAAGGR